MSLKADLNPSCGDLVKSLDAAVSSTKNVGEICQKVKAVLETKLNRQNDFLPEAFLKAESPSYARRCLYKDPSDQFSVVVMIWDVGQGTPLHDHAGHWCVECVYRGTIKVVSYDLKEENEEGLARFSAQDTVHAGIGAAGALIPPFEYHTIENDTDEKAITIHVYGNEITWCHIFQPTEKTGWYRRQRKEMVYSAP